MQRPALLDEGRLREQSAPGEIDQSAQVFSRCGTRRRERLRLEGKSSLDWLAASSADAPEPFAGGLPKPATSALVGEQISLAPT
jgi:hypothetical protein